MRKLFILFITLSCLQLHSQQVKILFDATKAETAGNADWVIDADTHNLSWNPNASTTSGGNESNPQRFPTLPQSGVTASTSETYWQGALSAWGIDCVKSGYWVETLPVTGLITYGDTTNVQDLSNYKVFIVDEPNIRFTTSEKSALIQFVQNGGGLFMISDHIVSDRNNDGWDSPVIWNDFVNAYNNPFGITWDSANFSQVTTNIPNLPGDSLLNGPYGNVTEMQYANGTSMTLNPAKNSSVKGVVYMTGSSFGNTGVMMAYARYGNGKVAAMGDSSPTDDGTGDPNDNLYNGWTVDAAGNHEKLIMNATIWLAETSVPVVSSFGLSTTKDTTLCAGSPVTMTAHGATSYLWQPGGYTTAGITVTPTTSGLYIVTGTNGSVVKSDTITITVDQFAHTTPLISANGPLAICAGSSVVLSAPSANTWHWNTSSTQQNITVSQAGTYYATLTDANHCAAKSDTVTVTVDQFPSTLPQITPHDVLTLCPGGSSTVSAPGGYSYQWSTGSTLQNISVSQAGAYFLTVTDANNCNAKSDTLTVTMDPFSLTIPPLTPHGLITLCQGNNSTISAPGGYSYQWNTGSTSQNISVSQPGVYYATVTDANNCQVKSDSATITIDQFASTTPQISASGPLTFCTGGNVVLSAPAGYTYTWSTGSASQSITVAQSGAYYLSLTDNNNCPAKSDTAVVSVSALLSGVLLSPGTLVKFCAGGNTTLSAPTGYASYLWNTGSTGQNIIVSQSGNYFVTVSTGGNCSGISDTAVVQADSFNVSQLIVNASGATTFCLGGNVTLSASTGHSYFWSNGSTIQNDYIDQTGNYTVTVTDLNNCSAVSGATAVVVNPLPVVTFQLNPDSVCSTAGAVQLTGATPVGGTFTGAGVNGVQFDPSVAGLGTFNITYHFTDANGCSNSLAKTMVVEQCTGVQNLPESNIRVYPNPSSGGFLFMFSGFKLNTIRVYDAEGKLIIENNELVNRSSLSVDLSNYAPGIYLAVLSNEMSAFRSVLVKTE